jgi:predicted nucleotidyltransferase component of viral defense system
MSLFETLVKEALKHQSDLTPLQVVVEKELLHHDILREMSKGGYLDSLTFIGGTCLRTCYGASRLSEDLDFACTGSFKKEMLKELGPSLITTLQKKYSLDVSVVEPKKRIEGNVDTWKIKVVTRPEQKMLPAQRINIDVCLVPSYDRRPSMLLNSYGVDMGTSGLIIQAESMEEILIDKIIALARRPNRIKNRDLWDIGWLKQQRVVGNMEFIPLKLADRDVSKEEFIDQLEGRIRQLGATEKDYSDFCHEMRRFLPVQVVVQTIDNADFWTYLLQIVKQEGQRVIDYLNQSAPDHVFSM